MTVGERIKQRRKELGMTQEELGKKLGYGKSAVCRVEREGNNITTDRITRFAKALDTTPGYLMGWEIPNGEDSVRVHITDDYGNPRYSHYKTIASPEEGFIKRINSYLAYILESEYAQRLVEEAKKSSSEDVQLATEFLMRLNQK